jgi:hypothetical protein
MTLWYFLAMEVGHGEKSSNSNRTVGAKSNRTPSTPWNTLRRDYFANRVFDCLDAATTQAEKGLAEMAANNEAMRRLTNWPWISAILKT